MKKTWRLLTTTLLMVIIACGLSISASAALTVSGGTAGTDYQFYGGGDEQLIILDGGNYTVSGEGSSITFRDPTDGDVLNDSVTLNLNGVTLTDGCPCIKTGNMYKAINLTLTGTNTLNNGNADYPAIECGVTPVTITGGGTLAITSSNFGIHLSESDGSLGITDIGGLTIDAVGIGIYMQYGNLNLSSTGAVSVNSTGNDAILVSSGSATISAASLALTSTGDDGINANNGISITTTAGDVTVKAGGQGIVTSADAITVNAKGDITVDATKDSIKCRNYDISLTAGGDISVKNTDSNYGGIVTTAALDVSCGGNFTVDAQEIAVAGDPTTLKVDGDITVTSQTEHGIKANGETLTISGKDNNKAGNITITAKGNQGIYTKSCNISAASLEITAGDDGIYTSEGTIINTTGDLSVSSTNSGNATFAAIVGNTSIDLTVGGNTTLTATGAKGYGARLSDDGTITINGTGAVNVTSADHYAIDGLNIDLTGSAITLSGSVYAIDSDGTIDFNNSSVTIDGGVVEAGSITNATKIQKGVLSSKDESKVDIYGTVTLDQSVGSTGGTATIHEGAALTIGDDGRLIPTTIVNNGTLTIYDKNSIQSDATFSGNGAYYITTSSLSADDITVPTDLKYTGAALDTSDIDIDLSHTKQTICGQEFTVVGASSDESTWDYTILKNDVEVNEVVEASCNSPSNQVAYIVRYTNGTTTLDKEFTVAKGDPVVTMFVLNKDMTAIVDSITYGDKVNFVAVVGAETMGAGAVLDLVRGKVPSAGAESLAGMEGNYIQFQYDTSSNFLNPYVALTDNGDGFSYAIKSYDTAARTLEIASNATSGTYSITASHKGGYNWNNATTVNSHRLTMGQKAVTFAAKSALEKTYNKSVYSRLLSSGNGALAITGKVSNDDNLVLAVTLTTDGVNAGAYSLANENLTITDLELADSHAQYYKVDEAACTDEVVTINPVSLTGAMFADLEARSYTGSAITPTVIPTASVDVPDGTLVLNQDYTVAYTKNQNAGTAEIAIAGKGNYSRTVYKSFTINPVALSITSVSVDGKGYDGTTATTGGTITLSGAVNNETPVASGTFTWDDASANTATVDIANIALTNDDVNKNYTLATTSLADQAVNTTITTRAITITANDQEVTYGTAISQLTTDVTDDTLISGHSISTVTLTQNSVNVTPVGDEALTITPSAVTILDGNDNDVTANYAITYADGTLDIDAKPITSAMITAITNQVYTGSAIEPTVIVTDGSIMTDDDWSVAYTNNLNVGTATVTITAETDGNYMDADPKASKTFNIVQSGTEFTGGVTTDKANPTYGDTIHIYVTPTATGVAPVANSALMVMSLDVPATNQMALFIGNTQITQPQTVTEGEQLTFTINTADKALAIGDNTITAKYTAGDNMAAQEGTVTINLSKKAITSATIETGVTKEYDGNATFTDIDLILGNDIEGADTVTATATLTRTTANVADADTFTVTSVSDLSGAQAEYYTLATTGVATTGSVDITAKALTITTKEQEVTYGTAISSDADDVTVVGLITGEALDSIVLTESDKNVATLAKTVNAATPVIKKGDAVIANTNYTITFNDTGVLTITAKPIVASWTAITTEYTGSAQVPSVAFVGLVGEDVMGEIVPINTNAGTYTVELSYTNTNYTVSNPSTSFTIEKAPVTFTLNADGTVTASPDKAFSVQYVSSKGEASSVIPTDSGSYTVNVTLTDGDNYRVTGSGTATANIGTYTQNAKTYTATFGTETITTLEQSTLIVPSGADKSVSEVFAGWTLDDITYKAGEVFTQPSKNVEFEAAYQEVHDIDGYVYAYNTTNGIEGAVVTLVQGSKQIQQVTTDETGAYDFGDVAEGVYNVVVAYDSTSKTALADISTTDAHVNIIMPQYKTSSVVEVTAGTPNVVVGGLDDIAATYGNPTNVVEVKLSVAQTTTTVPEIEEKAPNVAFYLDIDVSKTVNNADESGYNETSGLVELMIPIPAQFQGKASYSIFREHEGEVTELKVGTEGERIEIHGTNIHLFAKYFSTYALAYTEYSTSTVAPSYTSSVASSANGDVTISGNRNILNSTVTITADPDKGYEVGDVSVTYSSGREVSVTDNGDGTYSYKQPGAAVTVTVTFVKEGTAETAGFTDVNANAYYYDAMVWAVENGITAGYADNTFRPTLACNRAQAVTFLWRAAGEPKVTMGNPFSDLDEDAYYYDAVLWAVENGITTGYDDGTFRPDTTCNRGQIVTFLYRFAGEPVVSGDAMPDVAEGSYCYNAVLWAVKHGITTGYSDGTFGPTTTCNRGAIVTFLYRYLAQ